MRKDTQSFLLTPQMCTYVHIQLHTCAHTQISLRSSSEFVPEEQTEEADDQAGPDGEDVSQLHVVRWSTRPMLDCGVGVKAIVHHCVCKIALTGTVKRSKLNGLLEKGEWLCISGPSLQLFRRSWSLLGI